MIGYRYSIEQTTGLAEHKPIRLTRISLARNCALAELLGEKREKLYQIFADFPEVEEVVIFAASVEIHGSISEDVSAHIRRRLKEVFNMSQMLTAKIS